MGVVLCLIKLIVSECPPVSVQENFNVEEYVRAPWYIQRQQNVQYLPPNENYCTRANYSLVDSTHVSVFNYANSNQVNGHVNGGYLCAVISNVTEPAKLAVGPCQLSDKFYGPYWVVAAGPSSDHYEWALISGGQPTHQTIHGCTCGTGTNGSGLWVFSRSQVASQDEINQVVSIAQTKGFDITILAPVIQEGCKYLN